METWRRVWRDGFAPVFSTACLEALWHALRNDDARLLQGATSSPPPLRRHSDLPVSGCCSIGWCGWQGEKLTTVAEVEEFFARSCYEADQRLGEPGGCRWFLNWYDDSPRQEMRLELLAEVERALEQRFVAEHLERAFRRRQRAPRLQVSAA
jgi:hypothetical protein